MKFVIDYRERHAVDFAEDVCEEVSFSQLPIGDYLLVSGSTAVIVERKAVSDFLSSVRTNRLWDQLLRMIKAEKVMGYEKESSLTSRELPELPT